MNRKHYRRILSSLLAASMLTSLLCPVVGAADAGGQSAYTLEPTNALSATTPEEDQPRSGLYPGYSYVDSTTGKTVTIGNEYYAFMDTNLTFEERAVDLVGRMTLEEKTSQLIEDAPAVARLGIPAYDWWSEALHGVARDGYATSFPTALGFASSWNTELMERITSATADEAREKFEVHSNTHGLSYWSPTINMARDPRWGRAEETYGEDPYLAGQIASAFITGLQGTNEDNGGYVKAMATVKHFAANNSEVNRHTGSSDMTDSELREFYLPAFQTAVEDAGVKSIMTSYNAVNGVPSSVNEYLVEDILRQTWGFDGYVVTDCDALTDVQKNHTDREWLIDLYDDEETYYAYLNTTKLPDEIVSKYALIAGVDNNCRDFLDSGSLTAVEEELIDEALVDIAVTRLFTARMETGEFDPDSMVPYAGDAYASGTQIASTANRALAVESAYESVILLKNENDALPLSQTEDKNVVIVGEFADEVILGDYSAAKSYVSISPLDGMETLLGADNITHISGLAVEYTTYLMNIKDPTIYDESGTALSTIDWDNNDGVYNCKVETAGNIGYTTGSDTNWIYFEEVDFTDAATVTFPMSSSDQGASSDVLVEIRLGDPEGGQSLGSVVVEQESSSSWSDWYTATLTYDPTQGGYAGPQEDVYFVFSPYFANADGYDEDEIAAIEAADVVIAYVGTDEDDSAEGSDRSTLELPREQATMINGLTEMNDNVVVYIQAVGQVDVEEFKDNVDAILWTTYNGEAQGTAFAELLYGLANPSAKLPYTWYTDVDQLDSVTEYGIYAVDGSNGRTYQYFEGDITYPFGYGLSYSSFEYSDLSMEVNGAAASSGVAVTPDDTVTLTFTVSNTSDMDGAEVAQVYAISPNADTQYDRPEMELVGFDKQTISANGAVEYSVDIELCDLFFWDEDNMIQAYDTGVYTLFVGANSADQALSVTIEMTEDTLTPAINATSIIPAGHIVEIGGSLDAPDLQASLNDQTFLTVDGSDDAVAVVFTSSNEEVATVDALTGAVTGVGGGVATITASVTYAGVTDIDTFPVYVVAEETDGVTIYMDDVATTGFDADSATEYTCTLDVFTIPTITVSGAEAEVVQATAANDYTATVTMDDVDYTILFVAATAPTIYDFTTMSEETFAEDWRVLNEDSADYELVSGTGLVAQTTNGDIYQTQTDGTNFFLTTVEGDFTMETEMIIPTAFTSNYQQGGLIVYGDNDNYLKLSYEYSSSSSGDSIQFGEEVDGTFAVVGYEKSTTDYSVIYFRLEKVGTTYTGSYSLDGETYTALGATQWDEENCEIGLYANRSVSSGGTSCEIQFPYVSILRYDLTAAGYYDFTTMTELDSNWTVLNESAEEWALTESGLEFTIPSGQPWRTNTGTENVFALEQPDGDWEAIAHLTWDNITVKYGKVAMFAYSDVDNYVGLAYQTSATDNAKGYFVSQMEVAADGNNYGQSSTLNPGINEAYLRIVKAGDSYTMSYSTDGTNYTTLVDDDAGETLTLADLKYITILGAADDDTNKATIKSVEVITAESIEVTGVTLDASSKTMVEGKTAALTATVSPSDATDQTVSWTTSNASVATVEDGVVTAVGAGTATITATTADGGYTASCDITVMEAYEAENGYYDFTQMTEEQIYGSWTIVNENADNWTADADGLTISTASGDTYATYNDAENIFLQTPQYDNWTMDTKIVLPYGFTTNYQQAGLIAWNSNADYVKLGYEYKSSGDHVQFSEEYGDSFSAINSITNDNLTEMYLRMEKMDDTYTAYYSLDGVTYINAGSTTWSDDCQIGFYAFHSYDSNAQSIDATFPYVSITEYVKTAVTGVALGSDTATVGIGESATLTATVQPADAYDQAVTWSSSDDAIATVSNGVVKGISSGTATITATTADGSFTASCEITVPYRVSATLVLTEGETGVYTLTAEDAISLRTIQTTLFVAGATDADSLSVTMADGVLEVMTTKTVTADGITVDVIAYVDKGADNASFTGDCALLTMAVTDGTATTAAIQAATIAGYVNVGDASGYGEVTFSTDAVGSGEATEGGDAETEPTTSASFFVEVASADTETGVSVFNLMLQNVSNVKALFFTLDGAYADATVEGVEDFNITKLTSAVAQDDEAESETITYMLAYKEGSFDMFSCTDPVQVGTITIVSETGATIVIDDVQVSDGDTTEDATVYEDEENEATTEDIFQLAAVKAELIAQIQAEEATYVEADYTNYGWTTLTTLFADAIQEIEAITTQEETEAVDLDSLFEEAAAILTLHETYDLNGDNVINMSDIACIIPFYGYTPLGEYAKYDVNGDGSILSDDYLIIYNNMGK